MKQHIKDLISVRPLNTVVGMSGREPVVRERHFRLFLEQRSTEGEGMCAKQES